MEKPRSLLKEIIIVIDGFFVLQKKNKQNVGFAEQKHLMPFSISSVRIAELWIENQAKVRLGRNIHMLLLKALKENLNKDLQLTNNFV